MTIFMQGYIPLGKIVLSPRGAFSCLQTCSGVSEENRNARQNTNRKDLVILTLWVGTTTS